MGTGQFRPGPRVVSGRAPHGRGRAGRTGCARLERPCRTHPTARAEPRRPGPPGRPRPRRPARAALARPAVTWSELDAAVDRRPRRGLAAAAPAPATRRPGPGRDGAAQHARLRGRLLRRAARRAGRGAGQPRLHRPGAAARARPTPARRCCICHRPGPRPGRRAAPPSCPRCAAVHGTPPVPRTAPRTRCPAVARRRRTWPCCSTPPAPRGDPKGAMLTHRALLANHEQVGRIDPPVVGPTTCCCWRCRCSTRTGSTPGSARSPTTAPPACWSSELRARPRRWTRSPRHRVSVLVGVPSMFLAWSGCGRELGAATASRAGGGLRRGAAGARRRGALHRGHRAPGARRVRPDRDRAGAHLHAGQPGAEAGLDRPAAARACELRLVGADGDGPVARRAWPSPRTTPTSWTSPTSRRHRPGRDRGPRRQPLHRLLAGRPGRARTPTAGGRTGDVAYADADGDLFLVDRLGELILVNGFNVYPHEVELVLDGAPGGGRVGGAGRAAPVHRRDRPGVRGAGAGPPVTGEELLAHCERNLARFKCPTAVEFVDALPHSAIGKVRKTAALRSRRRRDRDRTEVTDVHDPGSP